MSLAPLPRSTAVAAPRARLPLLRRVVAWGLTGALALAVLSLVTDGILVGRSGARAGLATGLTGAALGALLSLAMAPVVALLAEGLVALANTRVASLWLVLVAALAAVAGVLLTQALYRPHLGPYGVAIAGAAAAITGAAALGRATARRPALAVGLLLALGGASTTVDLLGSRVFYRDLHDLLALVTFTAALAALSPLRRRLAERLPLGVMLAAAALLSLAALVELRGVDGAAPGWRPRSWLYGRWQPVLGRLARGLIDGDGDGFSPLAWGGDCDDGDPQRNPLARDLPGDGVDQNCNGVDPPRVSTDAQRGLGEARGEPDLPDGAVRRVLLVTIDCLRGDLLRPDLFPRLLARAHAAGVVFTRLYAAGSRTNLSLPLLLRGTDEAPPIGERLARARIASSAVFGWYDPRLLEQALPGMGRWIVPSEAQRRFRAAEVTDHALAELAAVEGRHFLWLHYFDAHDAREPVPGLPARPTPPGLPADYGQYLTELVYIDQELDRLLSSLEQAGELGRTVVIVTGDHGEGFGAHGLRYHGVSAYEELVHVPGVLLAPGLGPRSYDGLVSHRDLPATVLGAFGLVRAQPDVEAFGRSWLRLGKAPQAALHRFVVSRSMRASRGDELSAMPMAAIVDGRRKLILTFEDGLRELYDPIADPREQVDLLPADPREADRLTAEIQLYRDLDGWP